MPITEETSQKLNLRLVKAMGHLNAVHRMVEERRYCIDVLHQLKAVQSALDKISEELLKQHLETCIVDAIKPEDRRRVSAELLQIFRKDPSLYQQADELEFLQEIETLAGAEETEKQTTKVCC